MKNIKKIATQSLSILALVLTAEMASADYRYATFVPSTHPLANGGIIPFIETVKTDSSGSLRYKLYQGGVLLGAKNVIQGLRDGVADMGQVVFSYYPSEFPYSNFIIEMGVYGKYPPAVTAAASEMILLHCDACMKEMKENGVLILGTSTTPPKQLLSKKDFSDIALLQGAKVRTSGALWDRWLRSVGAVPLAMSSSEQYEALSRGQIDAIMSSDTAMKSHSIWDIAKHVTMLDLGMNAALAGVAVGLGHWNEDLGSEDKNRVLKAAASAQIDITMAYMAEDEEVRKVADEKGLHYHKPSSELLRQIRAFSESEYETVLQKAKQTYGVSDPEPVMKQYMALIEKWEALFEPIQGDKTKMSELLWREVYSKLDVDTLGL